MEITGREVRSVVWTMIKHLPDMLTVEPFVAVVLEQLTLNFDRLCAFKNFMIDSTSQLAGAEEPPFSTAATMLL